MRRRRGSGDAVAEASDLNFAHRLLLANENAVTNIADLWVAAAMNVDNEDPFEPDSDVEEENEEEAAQPPTDSSPDINAASQREARTGFGASHRSFISTSSSKHNELTSSLWVGIAAWFTYATPTFCYFSSYTNYPFLTPTIIFCACHFYASWRKDTVGCARCSAVALEL
jgi:hypothetical protein